MAAQVPQLAGAVVHRRVRGEDQVVADLGDPGHGVGGGDALDDQPGIPGGGVGDVEVGGERVGVGEHDPPAGPHPGRRDDRLVEVDRRRVGADHLPGAAPTRAPMRSPTRVGGAPPVGVVPARDEVVAPLAVHDVGHGLGDPGRAGRRASCRRGRPSRPAGGTARAGRWRRGRRRARGPARSARTSCQERTHRGAGASTPTVPLLVVAVLDGLAHRAVLGDGARQPTGSSGPGRG